MVWLLPILTAPGLVAFIVLALTPGDLPRPAVVWIGVFSPVVSLALLAIVLAGCGWGACRSGSIAALAGFDVAGIAVSIGMSLDPLSLVASTTVVGIATWVLIYASGYMAREPTADVQRFFALMNLFLAGMLAIVLSTDAVLLFLGWEVVGFCSFFLIAYYTRSPVAVAAGRKALLITHIADVLLLSGLIIVILTAGGTGFDAMMTAAPAMGGWRFDAAIGLIAAGALGKSAQIPFQIWLPSAMTGPTPVSALLHSATMVAAGVILLARLAPLLSMAAPIAASVAAIGVATAVLAALAALAQRDVKRLLAYSTISQIGLMMLTLGVGARDVALAHFSVHAVFKSLLFLSSGVMSRGAAGSTAIAALRGSMRRQPVAFLTFAVGAAALAGLPLVTAGWFSKEAVLSAAWASGPAGVVPWSLVVVTAFMTAAYGLRVVFVAASPAPRATAGRPAGLAMGLPLVVLATLSVIGGPFVAWLIRLLGDLPDAAPMLLLLAAAAAPILGAGLALFLVLHPMRMEALQRLLRWTGLPDVLCYLYIVRGFRLLIVRLSGSDAGSDRPAGDIIGRALVAATLWFARAAVAAVTPDAIDIAWMRTAVWLGRLSDAARRLQTGRIRDYAMSLSAGVGFLVLFGWGLSWH